MKQSLAVLFGMVKVMLISMVGTMAHADMAGDIAIVPSQLGLIGDFTLSTESLLMISVVLVALVMIPRKRKAP